MANTWHPRYDETGNIEFDIAILELAEDIAWSDAYQPICAPRSGDDGYVGETCSVSGWGSTQSGGTFHFPSMLNILMLLITSH